MWQFDFSHDLFVLFLCLLAHSQQQFFFLKVLWQRASRILLQIKILLKSSASPVELRFRALPEPVFEFILDLLLFLDSHQLLYLFDFLFETSAGSKVVLGRRAGLWLWRSFIWASLFFNEHG